MEAEAFLKELSERMENQVKILHQSEKDERLQDRALLIKEIQKL
jgi:hypothetical protein